MSQKKKDQTVTAYVDLEFYKRLQTLKSERKKLSPPGYKSKSEWAAHLLELGMNAEEKALRKLKLEKKGGDEEE